VTPNLPSRVVVGANGAYWRDYTDSDHPGYSMCPVSEDNEPVEVVAVYVRATPTPDTLDAAWAAAEAELPDGWDILSLIFDAGRWGAAAYDASFTGRPWHQRYRRASGDTPVAALIALAGVFEAER